MMHRRCLRPNPLVLPGVLRACASLSDLTTGKTLRSLITRSLFLDNAFVASAQIAMYAKCGQLDSARKLFDRTPDRDLVVWNSMFSGYARIFDGTPDDAFYGFASSSIERPTAQSMGYAAADPSSPLEDPTHLPDNKMASSAGPSKETSDEELPIVLSLGAVNLFKSGHSFYPELGAMPIRSDPVAYNKLMKTFAKAGEVDEALRLFSQMKESECNPNVLCYNTVINALVITGRTQEAEETFKEMLASGIAPNVSSYNIMVKLHSCYSEQFDLAYEVIQRMAKCGYSPDSTTYSTLIAGLCRAGRIGEAWGVLDWMLEEKCTPTVHTYTPIVQGYCLEGRVVEAKKLMATMESVGCPPNSVTYNILIEALCKVGSFDEVDEVIKESILKGWKPNAITYNTYMSGLCKWGKAKEAFEVFEVMLRGKLYPTVVTLNILLNCLCRDSKISGAKFLLERSCELEWGVSVVGYNTVMSRLCEVGNWLAVLQLLTDMIKKGITPNIRTFNIVIHSLCRGGKINRAMCFMESGGFVANVVTYNTLIHWFYQEGRTKEAHLLFSNMKLDKIAPDLITYSIMIDGLCKERKFLEAINYFFMSLESRKSLEVAVGLISRLIKSRKFREMLYLFEGMARRGFFPDVTIFDLSIRVFCSQGCCQSREIFVVCLVLDKMLTRR